jgi:large subunit ribosomal protein L22
VSRPEQDSTVRLNHHKLRALAEQSGIDAQTLAEALPRETDRRKESDRAQRAVRNWLAGRDHPRATRAQIEAMASVLGVEPAKIARFTSVRRFARSSPRKAALIADLIRGRRVDEATTILGFSPRRAAVMVGKTLAAAIADAEAHDVPVDRLVVSESHVGTSVIIKRFQPKDRGRAHPIQKKTSHITVGVEEAE